MSGGAHLRGLPSRQPCGDEGLAIVSDLTGRESNPRLSAPIAIFLTTIHQLACGIPVIQMLLRIFGQKLVCMSV